MKIVHGRPRHPQSQGLIERANAILTDALGNHLEIAEKVRICIASCV